MRPNEFYHVISIPGANWHVLFNYVWSRHTLLEKTIIYPLTEKNPITMEVTLTQKSDPNQFAALSKKLKVLSIFVIMCPLTPIEFRVYNAMIAIEMTNFIIDTVIKLL